MPAQDIQQCTAASTPLIGNYVDRDCGTAGLAEVASGQERCTYPECTKVFKKKEHLKRHVRVSHMQNSETYKCPAAKCSSTFKGRRDNFKSHLLLHIQGKSTRMSYDEKAVKCYNEMFLQKEKRRKSLKADTTALAGN
ncbi:hypothetical protein CcaCcLH18_11983 [Colletotrichum camelliae]|nr:hypothetical protein CcaCcLH18_11983 [Colletotrichum camelliae]